MIGYTARQLSGFERLLSTRSLIALRMVTSFTAYFFVSVSRLSYPPHFRYSYIQRQLFYSLLSLAFQLDVSRKFGHSGFLIFWMLNYCGILAVYVLPLSFSHDMRLII